MVNIADAILGKYPDSLMKIAGVKKGRGRPRKVVEVEGIYIHKESEVSSFKALNPVLKHKINERNKQLINLNPELELELRMEQLSEEFDLTYAQIHDLIMQFRISITI